MSRKDKKDELDYPILSTLSDGTYQAQGPDFVVTAKTSEAVLEKFILETARRIGKQLTEEDLALIGVVSHDIAEAPYQQRYGEHYIDVFSEGRDVGRPLMSLYDDPGLKLFFTLLTFNPLVSLETFKNGNLALVSYHVSQELQTGTAMYQIQKDGTLLLILEQGMLAGLLDRLSIVHARIHQ